MSFAMLFVASEANLSPAEDMFVTCSERLLTISPMLDCKEAKDAFG